MTAMLETVSEPPYGWWPDRPDEFDQAKNERFNPDVVTELDVVDDEIAGFRVYVNCEDCDESDEALEMVRQHDGAWLCWHCDVRQRNEYAEQQAYLDSIRYW